MAAKNDTIGRTITVTVLLCVVCSVIVSAAAVLLKPQQLINKELDRQSNILAAAQIDYQGQDIQKLFADKIVTKYVDLKTGKYVEKPATYRDAKRAAKDPALSTALTRKQDIASIKRTADVMPVYLVNKDDQLKKVILPVHGYGLWSTLYGFLALEGDLNTVVGFGFYSHGETPGLGGEVDNPKWKALWPGKKVYAEGSMEPKLGLVKVAVVPGAPGSEFKVDALSGATITSNGVTKLVQFWMGKNGYATYLTSLKAGES
ncbi:MAG: Na(+)-translocating NADH-quinone reductase subunit C [Pseudomonadales bacterium]|nr:Na(+)-translocating NADH-quinone reductase subunit C [Pseudomonadales bacterium]NRA14172.1 Na(+)-translocating NADH-quinone reductase subunit C [Oceanospirillaceae bacterium]